MEDTPAIRTEDFESVLLALRYTAQGLALRKAAHAFHQGPGLVSRQRITANLIAAAEAIEAQAKAHMEPSNES
jgi:hypothetical protein